MHLGGHGPPYTWCKKRDESFICKKLDRVLVNDTALRDLQVHTLCLRRRVALIIFEVEFIYNKIQRKLKDHSNMSVL